jgi:hypothetical protein
MLKKSEAIPPLTLCAIMADNRVIFNFLWNPKSVAVSKCFRNDAHYREH